MWELSKLDYGALIDPDQYQKRWDAVLKYYKGEAAKAMAFIDRDEEVELIKIQRDRVQDN